MSLLDDLPHVAQLYVATVSTDSYGNDVRVPSTEPIEIRCRIWQTRNATEIGSGNARDTEYKMITRDVPVTLFCKIVWNGLQLIPLSVIEHNDSAATRHTSTTLQLS